MAYPQGLNCRATAAFVTDVSPADAELGAIADLNQPDYPWTTVQGNNVGWEGTVSGTFGTRDRSTSPDARLAGCHFLDNTVTRDLRFDLPSAGSYNVRLAAGDYNYARADLKVELFDTSSSLGVLCNGATAASQRFLDATGTDLTAAAWPGSNTAVAKTFATTICRFRIGGGASSLTFIAHAYVESAGVALIYTPQITQVNAGGWIGRVYV